MSYLLLTLLFACSDPFDDVKKADTIEAYEQYLTTDPSGSNKMLAEQRLSDLMTERARTTRALADFDAVIKRFPSHREIKKLKEERVQAAFNEAVKVNTLEGWKAFLDQNQEAASDLKRIARDRISVLDYGKIVLSELQMKEINLANDPKGPINGWGFYTTVTNTGDKAVQYLNIEVRLFDTEGKPLKAYRWPAAATSGPGGMPILSAHTKPIQPGESRNWEYTTDEIPEGWSKKGDVIPVALRLVGTAANDGAQEK